MVLPLEGLRILELAGPPGAWAAGMLADFGADVIKVARVPLPQRKFSHYGLTEIGSKDDQLKSAAYNPYDRNKRSIAIDLKSNEGREIFFNLVKTADVELESFRPGVAQRLGIDYERLRKINPRLIYCAVTGYGQYGPYRGVAGHDVNYQAMAGIISLTGKRRGSPIIPGGQIGDWGGGGSQAIIGILLALMAREKIGKGQLVDISMTDGIISWLMHYARDYFAEGFLPARGNSVHTGSAPWHNIYKAKDGKYISIGCWEPHLWENLCLALGREDLIPHQFATGRKLREIDSALKEAFLTKTRDEWFESLKNRDIGIAPVYALDEVFRDRHVLQRNTVIELSHPTYDKVKQVGISIKLSHTPGKVRTFAPLDGQNTREILQELGYSTKRVNELSRAGVIVQTRVWPTANGQKARNVNGE